MDIESNNNSEAKEALELDTDLEEDQLLYYPNLQSPFTGGFKHAALSPIWHLSLLIALPFFDKGT